MFPPDEICLIVAGHALLYALALWFTRRPIVTLFHLFLVTSALAFVARPALALLAGRYTLYPTGDTWASYTLGLVYQLIFNLCFIIGYMLVRPQAKKKDLPVVTTSTSRGWWLSLLVGVATVGIIHTLSGGVWLPTARFGTITSAVPFGKVLFPLAVIPLSTGLPLGYLVALRKRMLRPIVTIAVAGAILLLSLLYQRGFVISGLVVAILLAERLGGLSYRKAAMVGGLAITALFMLRPLGLILSGASLTEVFGDGMLSKVRHFVLGPNFDIADVWPVAIEYSRVVGFVGGGTFLAIPARFFTPGFRQEIGLLTGVDRLNDFYWGQQYWLTNFGFNINIAQELYINFGPAAIVLGFVPGLITAWIDRWLWNLKRLDTRAVYLVSAALATGGFAGEVGGALQWAITFAGIGHAIWLGSRVVLLPTCHKGCSTILGPPMAEGSTGFLPPSLGGKTPHLGPMSSREPNHD